jgi:hypothetical protein
MWQHMPDPFQINSLNQIPVSWSKSVVYKYTFKCELISTNKSHSKNVLINRLPMVCTDFLFKSDQWLCLDWKMDKSIIDINCDNDLFCLINQSLCNTSQLFPNLICVVTKLWFSMKFIHCRSDNEQRPPRKLHSSEEWEMPRAMTIEEFETKQNKNKNKNKNMNKNI